MRLVGYDFEYEFREPRIQLYFVPKVQKKLLKQNACKPWIANLSGLWVRV